MIIPSDYWSTLQSPLFTFIEQVAETRLTEKEKRVVAIMNVIGVEKLPDHHAIKVAAQALTIFAPWSERS